MGKSYYHKHRKEYLSMDQFTRYAIKLRDQGRRKLKSDMIAGRKYRYKQLRRFMGKQEAKRWYKRQFKIK